MNGLSSIFIKRPVATTLLTLGLALAGILAFRLLPVSPLPQVDFPTIAVSAALPGADPETMATSVAAPLERQFGRIAGVSEMTSSSSRGSTNITLQFDLDRNIDGAARDVQAAINAARSQLPANLPANPGYRKLNPADAPVLILALTSETVSRPRMYDVASTILQQRLSQVPGVGQVSVGGGSLPAVRLELNPTALAHYGLSLEDMRAFVASTSVNRPKGSFEEASLSYIVEANDQLAKAAQYRELVVAYKNGRAVRVSDVAEVVDSVEDVRAMGLVNSKPSVLLIVFRQPGANIIEAVDNVRALMPQLEASLPEGVSFDVVMDRTPSIRGSLRDVEFSLVLSCLLVVVVVYAFLRDARSTVIPAVAVVVSLVGTFSAMYLLGYSLDNLSLMALTIATGFVVDDAIVVLENITLHVERGANPMEASLRGASEISFTVFSISMSLIAVFIPILLMGGMVGRLFREFAVTLSVAILVSMVVSLTTTPMMCAWLLRGRVPSPGHDAPKRGVVAFMLGRYETSLTWAMRHPRLMLLLTVGLLGLNVWLYVLVPKGFFPQQDTGRMMGMVQAAQDTSFEAMSRKMTQIVRIVQSDPDVLYAVGFTGGGGGPGGGGSSGRLFVTLRPFEVRKASVDQVMARLRRQLMSIPGAPTFFQSAQDLRIGGRSSNALYQYTLQGETFRDISTWAPRMVEKFRTLPELTDVNSDQQDRGLQTEITIDRPTAFRLGISPRIVDNILGDAFGQSQVAVYYSLLNQYHVIMEVAPRHLQHPESLRDIYVPGTGGQLVPLSAFATFKQTNTSLSVNHQGQFPAITLSFNLPIGVSLGQAVAAMERATVELGVPASIRGSFQGSAQAFMSSMRNQPLLILAALLTVYIVLGILYESYIHPLTILSTLPSAGVGAVLSLLLFGMDLNVIAIIGIILLIGIVKKNGIMIVDYALEAQRREGLCDEEAIVHACLRRFRPIMMTTVAALFGALPLAFGLGVGWELRQPLGVSIVGGLILSQLLTLYTTPIIYLYMNRLGRFFGGDPVKA